MKKTIKVGIPATSANLGAGFDVMGLAVNLYNYVELQWDSEANEGLEINVNGSGTKQVEHGKDNLVYRTVERILTEKSNTQIDLDKLTINLDNNIPFSRGLGSSAAAIVGGAVATNALFNLGLDRETLLTSVLDLEGHADNLAPAIMGGLTTSLETSEGDLMVRKVNISQQLRPIMIVPDTELSTQKARSVLPEKVLFQDALYNLHRAPNLLLALQCGDLDLLYHSMDDMLHQPYRTKLMPGVAQLLEQLRGRKIPAAISGAGPTLIAIVGKNDYQETETHIKELAETTLTSYGFNGSVFALEPDNHGAQIC